MKRAIHALGVIAAVSAITACTESSSSSAPAPHETVPGSAATPATGTPASSPDGGGVDLAEGRSLWARGNCMQCHGADGTGTAMAGNLTDDEWVYCDGSVEGIREILISGIPKDKMTGPPRPLPMEPATKLVPEDKIDVLAEYVHSMSQ